MYFFRLAEVQRRLKEEEEERRNEEEEIRLASELKHLEVERLQKAMEKEDERRRLEEERMEVERKEVNKHFDRCDFVFEACSMCVCCLT